MNINPAKRCTRNYWLWKWPGFCFLLACVFSLVWNGTLVQKLPTYNTTASNAANSNGEVVDPPSVPLKETKSNFDTSPPIVSTYWNCTPTHHACDGYNGVLHIESGDYGGAGGTIFFQFVVGQLIYAEHHNLLPFIHFNNVSHLVYDPQVHGRNNSSVTQLLLASSVVTTSSLRDARMYHAIYPGPPLYKFDATKKESPILIPLEGTGVWNHYFHPVHPTFCPGDLSCSKKPLVRMKPEHVSPGLHIYAPWSPKIWRYHVMPDHMAQPHVPLREWLLPQRLRAATIVQKYYQFTSLITNTTTTNNNNNNNNNVTLSKDCLGIHVRWSDKGVARRRLSVSEFLPFVNAYWQARTDASSHHHHQQQQQQQHSRACLYVATDAMEVIEQIYSQWPFHILNNLILSSATIRSPNETAVFDMDSHHLTNQEVLRDIWELSQCGFLLHGNSAVSESAIYLNSDLIYQSVNLEDPTHPTPTDFQGLVYNVSVGAIDSFYWRNTYQPPRQWWEPSSTVVTVKPCTIPSDKNVTLSLSPDWKNDQFMPINRWTTLVFIKLLQQLAKTADTEGIQDDNVIVDPLWPTWFQQTTNTTSCHFSLKDYPATVQDAIRFLAASSFFQKRFQSVVTDELASDLRYKGHMVLSELLQIQPHIVQHAKKIFNVTTKPLECLGIHIPDPGYRRKVGNWTQQKYPKAMYLKYIQAYGAAGGKCIYLSTDSYTIWDTFVTTAIKNILNDNVWVYSQHNAVRNRNHVPAHYMEEKIQRLGSETLVDIVNLQQCGILLHGYSPVSEMALFWNPKLQSILLPAATDSSLDNFTNYVRTMLQVL